MNGWLVTSIVVNVILFVMVCRDTVMIKKKQDLIISWELLNATSSTEYSGKTYNYKGDNMRKGKLKKKQAKNGQWYFICEATNGRCMTTSEMYINEFNCERAMMAYEKYEWKQV